MIQIEFNLRLLRQSILIVVSVVTPVAMEETILEIQCQEWQSVCRRVSNYSDPRRSNAIG